MIFFRLFFGCLIQLIPFSFILFYSFKEHLKFGKPKTFLITAGLLITLSTLFSGICIHLSTCGIPKLTLFQYSNAVFMACLIPCFVWYLFAVEGIWQKKLFSFFLTITVALAMTSVENIMESWRQTEEQLDGLPYSENTIFSLAILTLVTLPLLWLMIKKLYLPVSDALSQKETNSICVISVVLFAVLASAIVPLEYSDLFNLASLYIFFALMVTVFTIYIICFKLLAISHDKLDAYERMIQMKHQLQMMDEQYNRIQDKIESSKKARHDIRHHFVALQGFLKSNDIDSAERYLEHYVSDFEKDGIQEFCSNSIVNTVIGYYVQQAKDLNIVLNTKISIPEQLSIQDEDLAVLLGNLLENSISAASRANDENRFITMNMMITGNMFVIAIDNGFDGKIKKKDDRYLSLKELHIGYGLSSVQSIADKYDGGVEFSNDTKVFHSSVMLNIGEEKV